MNSLFISLDLGTNSSGNLVSEHELEFLKSTSDSTIQLGYQDISPKVYNLPDNPFLADYLALHKLSQLDLSNVDIAHFYGTTYTNTIRYLHARGIRCTNTIAAHDRIESIKEFEILGYQYPFNHVSDNRLWLIYSGAMHETDIVITPSESSAKFLTSENCKRIEIIPHGIDIPKSDKIIPISDNFKVGYLGAIGPDKGLKYLIQAWSLLNYKDNILIFGGINSNELGPFINRYATGGKFHLTGLIENIADFYNNISIYVQPSVTEGWGIEVIEAMSFGRPVICSDGAGAADAIKNGFNGFIVPKRDPQVIANKIQYFKDNPKEIERMGENARNKSLNYDWSVIRQKYTDSWKSII